jgi:hypothetical protein
MGRLKPKPFCNIRTVRLLNMEVKFMESNAPRATEKTSKASQIGDVATRMVICPRHPTMQQDTPGIIRMDCFDLTKHGPKIVAGKNYKSKMPAYEQTLSDKEIISVLSFIKSKWPSEIKKRHDEMNAAHRQR